MRVVQYHANDDIRLIEQRAPTAAAGEIVIALRACGICASDVLDWYMRPRAPLFPGHEVVGVVASTGEGVRDPRRGDRVWVHHHAPCGTCALCRRGAPTNCPQFRATRLRPGGLAEYIAVPAPIVATSVHRLPDFLPDAAATLIEPLACCVRSLRRAGFRPGADVLVVGAGITGLLHVRLARAWGAARIEVVEIEPSRHAAALRSGADRAMTPEDPEALALVVPTVIVTPASLRAIAWALERVAPGGTLLQFGPTGPGETLPFEPHRAFFREVTLTSSYSAGVDDGTTALSIIARDPRFCDGLIDRVLPLEEAPEAFRLTATHRESLKIVLTATAPA